ncbi:MAG: hypothetical protein K8R88_10960 [Armatimonadetes bacterium]|nr:hypothetical protein [Armatimonadota bacterium]
MTPEPSRMDRATGVHRLPPKMGKIGLAIAIVAAVGAVSLQIYLAVQRENPLHPAYLVFAALYLPGAFLASATYGYTRGSKLYYTLMACRMGMAMSLVWGVMRATGQA